MSEVENPVDTVARLLSKNMRVVKEDGSLASVFVSREWLDRELFKNVDGQVTIGLAESLDAKLELSGRLRRRLGSLRVSVWSQDALTRQKMVEEVNRIVHQNRSKPNVTEYNFVGLGYPSGDPHTAFQAAAQDELAPEAVGWIELAAVEYQKVWYSDDDHHSKSTSVNGECVLMLFRFKVGSREHTVKSIVLTFEGYGTAPAGNGVTVKVWNRVAQAWQQAQNGLGGADETITLALTTSITDYIDNGGYVWLLARTSNPSDGSTSATLYCDYAACAVMVNGIAYLDVVSYRDADRVDVKPFIFRTEFTLKSWSFEDIGGVF